MLFKDKKRGTAPTYQIVHDITQCYLSEFEEEDRKSAWEFLMIEVKRAQGILSTHGLDKLIKALSNIYRSYRRYRGDRGARPGAKPE